MADSSLYVNTMAEATSMPMLMNIKPAMVVLRTISTKLFSSGCGGLFVEYPSSLERLAGKLPPRPTNTKSRSGVSWT